MKRFAIFLLFSTLTLWTPLAVAQHSEGTEEAAHGTADEGESEEHGGGGNLTLWKWANFAILAGVLGYFAAKKGGAFFTSRTNEIRKGITEATKLKEEAEARLAQTEQRMANLEGAIKDLRENAKAEMSAEGERVKADTEQALGKVQTQGEHEIASSLKAAKQELKAYSAELALTLAEQKIRSSLTGEEQNSLLDSFVEGLPSKRNDNQKREREVN